MAVKITQLEAVKDAYGNFVEVNDADIEWKNIHVGTEVRRMPFERGTGVPLLMAGKCLSPTLFDFLAYVAKIIFIEVTTF